MKLRLLAPLAALSVAGCETYAPPPPPPPPPPRAQIVIQAPYRPEAFAWSTAIGSARIRGTTIPSKTCAGNAVVLTPDTLYSRERIRALYGSTEAASEPVERVRSRVIANDNSDMKRFIRVTQCDSAGTFNFANLPAGDFFVIAEVSDPSGPRVVMRRVNTRAGVVVPLALTAPPKTN